jgi:hypothetical protein
MVDIRIDVMKRGKAGAKMRRNPKKIKYKFRVIFNCKSSARFKIKIIYKIEL